MITLTLYILLNGEMNIQKLKMESMESCQHMAQEFRKTGDYLYIECKKPKAPKAKKQEIPA